MQLRKEWLQFVVKARSTVLKLPLAPLANQKVLINSKVPSDFPCFLQCSLSASRTCSKRWEGLGGSGS